MPTGWRPKVVGSASLARTCSGTICGPPQSRASMIARRLFRMDAHRIGIDLLDMIDPAEARILEQEIVLGVGRVLEGIDHVVGGHLAAVGEFDAAAELELHRLVVDLRPALGELAVIGLGRDVVADQRVEHRAVDEIGLGVGILRRVDQPDRLIDREAQRVMRLVGISRAADCHHSGGSPAAKIRVIMLVPPLFVLLLGAIMPISARADSRPKCTAGGKADSSTRY